MKHCMLGEIGFSYTPYLCQAFMFLKQAENGIIPEHI
jgi:hypothetical protein